MEWERYLGTYVTGKRKASSVLGQSVHNRNLVTAVKRILLSLVPNKVRYVRKYLASL
jgi:hypothetical protein